MNDLSESDALLKEVSILWIIKCDALLTKNIYNENYVKLVMKILTRCILKMSVKFQIKS